jgi:hypothetical protein
LASSSVVVVVVVVSSASVAGVVLSVVEGVVVVVVVEPLSHPVTTKAAHTSTSANKLLIACLLKTELYAKNHAPAGGNLLQYGGTTAQRLVAVAESS